jgi:hypothetical protein
MFIFVNLYVKLIFLSDDLAINISILFVYILLLYVYILEVRLIYL